MSLTGALSILLRVLIFEPRRAHLQMGSDGEGLLIGGVHQPASDVQQVGENT